MQHNCRLTAIILIIMFIASVVFMFYGVFIGIFFSLAIVLIYTLYLNDVKRKQTSFLKGLSNRYKMKLIITSDNVEKYMDLVPQILKENLFHINWVGFDYLRNKSNKIILSDYLLESISESPKFIFANMSYFVSHGNKSDQHSTVLCYVREAELNLPRFVIFPNYSSLLTTIKGNMAKKNYGKRYENQVPSSEIPIKNSNFEMFIDDETYSSAIINSDILPALIEIDKMKKDFSVTLICDVSDIFLATDNWVQKTSRMAKIIELFFKIRKEVSLLKR